MRLAYVTDGMFPAAMGGMGKISTYLALELQKYSPQMVIYAPEPSVGSPANAADELVKMGLNVNWMRWPKQKRFPGHYIVENLLFSRAVSQELEKEKYDVGYFQGFTASWPLLKRKRTAGMGVITSLHGFEPFQRFSSFGAFLRSLPLRPLTRLVSQRSDMNISYGKYFTDLLQNKLKVPRERISETPNAVTNQFLNICKKRVSERHTNEKPLFLFVGRYEERKGVELFCNLAEVFEDLNFHVVGTMPRWLTEKYKLQNLNFIGPIWAEEEMASKLTNSDCLVVPSYSEGMPTVILEGMAAAIPIIATGVGMVPEILPSDAGVIVSPGEFPALKQAVRDVSNKTYEERHAMGLSGRKKVEQRYTWEVVGRKSFEIIRDLHRSKSLASQ